MVGWVDIGRAEQVRVHVPCCLCLLGEGGMPAGLKSAAGVPMTAAGGVGPPCPPLFPCQSLLGP